MKFTPLALAALAGALLAWLAYDLLSPPVSVPDTTGPYVEQVVVAEAARRAAEAERDSVNQALADSTEAWRAERRRLAVVTAQARREADRIAQDLRVTLDTAGVRMLDELVESHATEVQSLTSTILTYESQVTALEAGMRTAELVIRAQRHEIEAWEALDAERQSMEAALRSALSKKTRTNRITQAVAVGAIALALVGG